MATISQLQQIYNEYQNFKNSLGTAQASLQNVIAQGTVLYNDNVLATTFPNSITAYKAYLVSAQNAINSFIASFPAEPNLNG
jgi:hypothetical protein